MPHKRSAFFLALALFAFPSLAAITGSVMTPDGKPLAGARVSTYAFESNGARRARLLSDQPEAVPLASTQTDAKGTFSLESPKNAVVTLRMSMRGYEPQERSVEKDEEGAVFIAQKAESRTSSISSGGKPVANATVVLSYSGAELIVKTNEEGRYDAPDSKRLNAITVIHPDFAVDDDGFFALSDKDRRAKMNRTLTKGAPLTGRVLAADGKTPASKAAITLNGWPLATSADDGTFTIERAPAKWETLIARKENLIAQRAFAKDVSTTLKLEKATTFAGRITDAKTKLPVAGAIVALGSRRFIRSSDAAPSMEVDAKGAYSFVAPAGTYSLTVSHPGYEGDLGEVGAAAGERG
ncbi:MAG TPA: carboxypeptidase regulatory-like domain-containing protein, partial [Thermoanaerobaculia bacterium]